MELTQVLIISPTKHAGRVSAASLFLPFKQAAFKHKQQPV